MLEIERPEQSLSSDAMWPSPVQVYLIFSHSCLLPSQRQKFISFSRCSHVRSSARPRSQWIQPRPERMKEDSRGRSRMASREGGRRLSPVEGTEEGGRGSSGTVGCEAGGELRACSGRSGGRCHTLKLLDFRMWLKLKIKQQFSHNFNFFLTFLFFTGNLV